MAIPVGQRLGPYEILSAIGAGGMGEVYRARDTKLGRNVAIKFLPAAFVNDPERLARFQREARLLAALNHHPKIETALTLQHASGAHYYLITDCLVPEGALGARQTSRCSVNSVICFSSIAKLRYGVFPMFSILCSKEPIWNRALPACISITFGSLPGVISWTLAGIGGHQIKMPPARLKSRLAAGTRLLRAPLRGAQL